MQGEALNIRKEGGKCKWLRWFYNKTLTFFLTKTNFNAFLNSAFIPKHFNETVICVFAERQVKVFKTRFPRKTWFAGSCFWNLSSVTKTKMIRNTTWKAKKMKKYLGLSSTSFTVHLGWTKFYCCIQWTRETIFQIKLKLDFLFPLSEYNRM